MQFRVGLTQSSSIPPISFNKILLDKFLWQPFGRTCSCQSWRGGTVFSRAVWTGKFVENSPCESLTIRERQDATKGRRFLLHVHRRSDNLVDGGSVGRCDNFGFSSVGHCQVSPRCKLRPSLPGMSESD